MKCLLACDDMVEGVIKGVRGWSSVGYVKFIN